MFRSLAIGLGSMCLIALAILAYQNSSDLRIGERLSQIELPALPLLNWSDAGPETPPEKEPWEISDEGILASFRDLQRQQNQLANAFDELREQNAENGNTIAMVQTTLQQIQREIASVRGLIPTGTDPALITQISGLETKVTELAEDIRSRSAPVGISATLFNALRQDVRRLDGELSEFRAASDVDANVAKLQGEVSSMAKALANIEAELDRFKSQRITSDGISVSVFQALREEVGRLSSELEGVDMTSDAIANVTDDLLQVQAVLDGMQDELQRMNYGTPFSAGVSITLFQALRQEVERIDAAVLDLSVRD